MLRSAFAAVSVMALSACNPMANADEAEKRIARFHTLYSAQDIDALHRAAGPTFRRAAPIEDFRKGMGSVYATLGKVTDSEQQGFNVSNDNGKVTTLVEMRTTFERGEGLEKFSFVGSGEDMQLEGWNITSDQLP